MMIALLASLAALLLAVAGVARHIWLQRARLSGTPASAAGAPQSVVSGGPGSEPATSADEDPADEIGHETEL